MYPFVEPEHRKAEANDTMVPRKTKIQRFLPEGRRNRFMYQVQAKAADVSGVQQPQSGHSGRFAKKVWFFTYE
jgi:hypothetical protein